MPSWLVLTVCLVASIGLILNLSLLKLRSRVRMPDHTRPFLHVFLVVNCITSGLLAPLDAVQIGVEAPSVWSPLCLATSSVAGVLFVTSALLVVSVATDRLWQLRKERHQHHHVHAYIPKFRPVNMVDSACAFFGGCLLTLPFVLHGRAVQASGGNFNVTSAATFDCMLQVKGLADRYYVIQGFMQACVLAVVVVSASVLLCYARRHEKWARVKAKSFQNLLHRGPRGALQEQKRGGFPSPGTVATSAGESTDHLITSGDTAKVGKLNEMSDNDKSTQHDASPMEPSSGHAHNHHAHHFSVAGELFGGPAHHQGNDDTGFVSHAHPKWHHSSAPPLRPHSSDDDNASPSRRHASAPPPRPQEDHAHRRHEYSLRAAALHSHGRLISTGLWRDVTPRSRRRNDDDSPVSDSDAGDASEKIDLSKYDIHRRWSRSIATQVDHGSLINKDASALRGITEDWTPGQDDEEEEDVPDDVDHHFQNPSAPEDVDPQYLDSAFGDDADTSQLFPSEKITSSCQASPSCVGIENPTFVYSVEDENSAVDDCGADSTLSLTAVDARKSPVNSASELSIAERSLDSSFTEEDNQSCIRKETIADVEVHGNLEDQSPDCGGEDEMEESEHFLESKQCPMVNSENPFLGSCSGVETTTTDNATPSLLDSKRNELELQSLSPDLRKFIMGEISISIPDDNSSLHTTDSHDMGIVIVARCGEDASGHEESDAESSTSSLGETMAYAFEQSTGRRRESTSVKGTALDQRATRSWKSYLDSRKPKRRSVDLDSEKPKAPSIDNIDGEKPKAPSVDIDSEKPKAPSVDDIDSEKAKAQYIDGEKPKTSVETPSLSRQDSPRKSCIKNDDVKGTQQLREVKKKDDAKASPRETTSDESSCLPSQHPNERGVTVLFLAMCAILVLTYLPSVLLRLVVAMATSDAIHGEFLAFRWLARAHYLLPPLFPVLLRYLRKFWM